MTYQAKCCVEWQCPFSTLHIPLPYSKLYAAQKCPFISPTATQPKISKSFHKYQSSSPFAHHSTHNSSMLLCLLLFLSLASAHHVSPYNRCIQRTKPKNCYGVNMCCSDHCKESGINVWEVAQCTTDHWGNMRGKPLCTCGDKAAPQVGVKVLRYT